MAPGAQNSFLQGSASGPCGSSTGLTACSGSCAFCHGTDGRTPPTLGRSFYPRVPDLSSAQVQAYSDAELFWIIKNGIHLSGMPGFGNIHSDEEIWDLVSYVRSLGAPSQR